MPTTGEICQRTGRYKGNCGHIHHFDRGDRFTPCTYCNRAVVWTWISL